jgi:two-component system cell cycle response regulator DivK
MKSADLPRSQTGDDSSQKNPQPAPKRILVADDLAMNRELMRDMLESSGYVVVEARDGGEAIREAYGGRPDLILLDIDMPVLNGFAVARRLRQDKDFLEIPIIAMTGLSSREDRERAFDAGFNSFLRKPFNLSNLRDEIECFLGLSSTRGRVRR